MINIWVPGIPVPQGSKVPGIATNKTTGRQYAFVRESTDAKLRPWRKAIVEAARAEMQRTGMLQLVGPVGLEVGFYFPWVQSDPDRIWKHTKPDLSKLVRAVEDALTDAGVWEDDSRVVETNLWKQHADRTGADIHVWTLAEINKAERLRAA